MSAENNAIEDAIKAVHDTITRLEETPISQKAKSSTIALAAIHAYEQRLWTDADAFLPSVKESGLSEDLLVEVLNTMCGDRMMMIAQYDAHLGSWVDCTHGGPIYKILRWRPLPS